MARFATAAHLCSWARFAPGVNESAGKSKGRGGTGHGNPLSGPGSRRGRDRRGYYDSRTSPDRRKRNHIRQLEALGYKVTVEPAA